MLAVALMSLFLSITTPKAADSRLTGVWVLNLQKSDWGGSVLPQEVTLRIEQADGSVSIWEVTTNTAGRHVSYRQLILKGAKCADGGPQAVNHSACFVTAQYEERWELSQVGELIVDREAKQGSQLVHQRLVLEPSVAVSD